MQANSNYQPFNDEQTAQPQQFNQPPQQQQQQQLNQPIQQQQQQYNNPPQQNQQAYNYPPMAQNQMPVNQMPVQQNQINQMGGNNFLDQQFSPLSKFDQMGGVYIKQKVNFIEAFTGCVQQNRYDVFQADMEGQQNSTLPFMTVKEHSSCCQRQCLPSQCRAYELNMIMNIEQGQPGSGMWTEQLVIKNKKECTCTCLCANRPIMEVFAETAQGQQKLGELRNPFKCCDLLVEANKTTQNQKNDLLYKVMGKCCQIGVLCQMWPCAPCQEVDFDVINNQGQVLLPLKKKSPGCWRACLGPTDYFSVIFPTGSTKEDRILLMVSAFMMDYMFFNDKPDQGNSAGGQ